MTGVDDIKTIPASQREAATAKGKFVVVLADVLNLGLERDAVGLDSPKLQDSKNRKFTLDVEPTTLGAASGYYKRPFLLSYIQPGITEPYVLIYDVAPDAIGYKLIP